MTQKSPSLFDWNIVGPAIGDSFVKLSPRLMVRNPVMFVTMVGAALTAVGIFTAEPALRGFVARPPGEGPFPAVLVMHSALGVRHMTREVAGKLAMKGVTRDVVVPVEVRKDAAGNTVAEARFAVKRLPYRIGDGPWSDPSVVADDVTVRARIVLGQ